MLGILSVLALCPNFKFYHVYLRRLIFSTPGQIMIGLTLVLRGRHGIMNNVLLTKRNSLYLFHHDASVSKAEGLYFSLVRLLICGEHNCYLDTVLCVVLIWA